MCNLTQIFKLCTCKNTTNTTFTWKFFKSNIPNKTVVVGTPENDLAHYYFNELAYEEKIEYLLNNTKQLFDVEMNIEIDDVLLFYKNNKPFLYFRYGNFFQWEHLKSSKLKHHELIKYGYIKYSKSN